MCLKQGSYSCPLCRSLFECACVCVPYVHMYMLLTGMVVIVYHVVYSVPNARVILVSTM